MRNARVVLRLLTPPIVWRLMGRLRQRARLDGPFPSWDAAAAQATGWDSPILTGLDVEIPLGMLA